MFLHAMSWSTSAQGLTLPNPPEPSWIGLPFSSLQTFRDDTSMAHLREIDPGVPGISDDPKDPDLPVDLYTNAMVSFGNCALDNHWIGFIQAVSRLDRASHARLRLKFKLRI